MNKTTWIMAVIVIIIVTAIGVGFVTSTNSSQPAVSTKSESEPPLPSQDELKEKLETEQAKIDTTLSKAFPNFTESYTLERGKLYQRGEWYGAILQYKGADENNRDTLRLLLQKKDDQWVVRTTPPRPLLSKLDLTDVPVSVLNDINQPATLPGTENSPAITPSE